MIPPKIIISGDEVLARQFIGPAKSQMEILLGQLQFQNLSQGIRRVRLAENVFVECQKFFDFQNITITALSVDIDRKMTIPVSGSLYYVIIYCEDYCFIWSIADQDYAVVLDENGDEIEFPVLTNDPNIQAWLESQTLIETDAYFSEYLAGWGHDHRIMQGGLLRPSFLATGACENEILDDWAVYINEGESNCFCDGCERTCSGSLTNCSYINHYISDPVSVPSVYSWYRSFVGANESVVNFGEDPLLYQLFQDSIAGTIWDSLDYLVTKQVSGTSGSDNGSPEWRTEELTYLFTTPLGTEEDSVIETYNSDTFLSISDATVQQETVEATLFAGYKSIPAICQIYVNYYSINVYQQETTPIDTMDRKFIVHGHADIVEDPLTIDPTSYERNEDFEQAVEDLINATYDNDYEIGGDEKKLSMAFYLRAVEEQEIDL